jgi:hypothetical protein
MGKRTLVALSQKKQVVTIINMSTFYSVQDADTYMAQTVLTFFKENVRIVREESLD